MYLTHELPIFINKESKCLILGSFPSVKSRKQNFYYGNPTNRFFKTLYLLFNEEYELDLEKRKEFLIKHKIALYDVIYSCDIKSSYDSSIKDVTPIDIKSILEEYKSIISIGITGKTAKKLFDKYLLNIVKSKNIKVVYLPSTSSANAKTSIEELVKEFKLLFN